MRQGRRWCIHYWASWETQLGNTVSLKSPYGTSTAQDSLGGRKGVEFICWHFLSPDVTGSGLFKGAWTPLHSGLCCQGGCDRQLGSPCSERLRPDIEWGEEGRAYMAQWIWGACWWSQVVALHADSLREKWWWWWEKNKTTEIVPSNMKITQKEKMEVLNVS